MKHLFVEVTGFMLGLLLYVMDRKTKTAIESRYEQVSIDIKQQLQNPAIQLHKAALPKINSNDARRHVQTSLNLILDVLQQLDITKPNVDIEVAASQAENT